jgi:O-antigen ligase
MGRVVVWDWTIDYVKANPLGGGFFIDRTNQVVISVDSDGDTGTRQQTERGKAFHSIYFEVLGEQGYPGFVLYFGIVLLSISRLCRVWFGSRNKPHARWEREMAYAFLVAWASLLVGAGFVGIAWLPLMFLMMAFSNCIYRFYVEKLDLTDPTERLGSRGDVHEY